MQMDKYFIGQRLKRVNRNYAEVTVDSINNGTIGIRDGIFTHYIKEKEIDANFTIVEPVSKKIKQIKG